MTLDVWYKSDVQNVLSAAEQASGAALRAASNRDDPYVAGYQAGYRAALVTVALAFGLVSSRPNPTDQQRLAAQETIAEGAWEEV
jgi:hypothetical protein